MDASTNTPVSPKQLAKANQWWSHCSDPWKRAFNEVALQRNSTEALPDELLLIVYQSPAHRFAGPKAPYPNMSFELDDLSGLVGLPNISILVVTFQRLTNVQEVKSMKSLRSLFVHDNRITSLEGVEALPDLQELYIQCNQITSLLPLAGLTQLKTLYCTDNLFSNLDGVGPQHADNLENFFCLPNPNLKDKTVFAFEQEVRIRCRKG